MSAVALFVRSAWQPLLLAAPALWLLLGTLDRARARALSTWVGPRLATLAPGALSRRRRPLRRVLWAMGLGLGLVATLHPAWGSSAQGERWRGLDLVVCLDVSRSMLATDVAPDRLTRARDEIRALSAGAEGDRVGLVLFAGEARVRVPLTHDRRSFVALLEQADGSEIRRGGTDLGAAVEAALGLLEVGRGEEGAILLVTDGEDLGGAGLRAAAQAAARGVRVHALGCGTALGSKIALQGAEGPRFLTDRTGREVVSALDAEGLRRIASAGRGAYADLSRPRSLLTLYQEQVLPSARAAVARTGGLQREDRYQLPLLLCIVLLLLDVLLTDRRRS